MREEMFNVGKIINTHGIRGEVKVKRISDFEDRFTVGEKLYLKNDENKYIALHIRSHRIHKGFDLLAFQEFDNINEVEQFKNAYLKITEEQLKELDHHEYYYHQIIGCAVESIEGDYIGEVKEILATGANDVWVIKREGKKDALIPYIEQVVKEVDIPAKKIKIEPMEGLLD